ncbi:hypothetical protein [Salipiger mucosus]|uniref:Uncharacterized protein n=1 Tax=Salipiger mucosus DSM 16094 TaxID=1123237 RepID=S9Q6V9_9RHOB|nr:hypothetical protein [Salipiger mucosus]EPX75762.1 hypothetical protein Salmuc_05400 [Salipiger mucosus DSM 16094]
MAFGPILAALLLAGGGTPGQAQTVAYSFEWQGGGGYAMRGALGFDSTLLGRDVIRAEDVECFFIEGTRHGAPLGRWALGELEDETTWVLTFRPQDAAFTVFGPEAPMPQAWNMNGFGQDCGAEGFGFNIGNAAQDLCHDGRLLRESQVDPRRSFPATRDDSVVFPGDACLAPMLMGRIDLPSLRPGP